MSGRLRVRDVVGTAWLGVAARPQRTMLAALGVALGIAAMIALTGAAASNRAHLLAEFDALGADLAVVAPGEGPDRKPVPLPGTAPETIARQDGVARVGVVETAPPGLAVYRTHLIPRTETSGVTVAVARPDLLAALDATVVSGRWFDDASRSLPTAVLGATAAERLGIDRAGDRVLIGGEWYGVIGILAPAGIVDSLDAAVFLGDRWIAEHLRAGDDPEIAAVYVRAEPGRLADVSAILAAAASPGSPYASVTRAADLLQARAVADDSLATLGLALGGIALLVGGVGIANTMLVSVMERRGEIGLRRSLGARPGQIATQFVTESAMLSLLGGAGGILLGVAGAAATAAVLRQPLALPIATILLAPIVSVMVGAFAGLQPAVRAARLAPTAALRSS